MKTYTVCCDINDEIMEPNVKINWLEMDTCETEQKAIESMKKMVRDCERTLREFDELPVIYWSEEENEIWGNDENGNKVEYKFYIMETELEIA